MCGLPTLECCLLFGFTYCLPSDQGGEGTEGAGGTAQGLQLKTALEERRDKVPQGPALVSRMGVWPGEKGRSAYTQPEHTDKSSGKLEKTFPFFPLTFYDNSYFQMKGEKSQERNS